MYKHTSASASNYTAHLHSMLMYMSYIHEYELHAFAYKRRTNSKIMILLLYCHVSTIQYQSRKWCNLSAEQSVCTNRLYSHMQIESFNSSSNRLCNRFELKYVRAFDNYPQRTLIPVRRSSAYLGSWVSWTCTDAIEEAVGPSLSSAAMSILDFFDGPSYVQQWQ